MSTAIRSGDSIATGTGTARRRLTLEEAAAGGLPERFTKAEWAAMYDTSIFEHMSYIKRAVAGSYNWHPFYKGDT